MVRRFSFTTTDQPVIGQVNTTPLIDVMLVLLILCVISIPMMTHKVSIQLPGGPSDGKPAIYRIDLAPDGALSWNGKAVSLSDLPRQLQIVKRDPDSLLEINAYGSARYAVVKRSGVENVGFVGIDGFASNLDH